VQYQEAKEQVKKLSNKSKASVVDFDIEIEWKIREISEKSLLKLLGKEFVPYQLFVPAGRSFFTSIGKAVAAFEQGRILDPLTVRFGRLFTTFKERRYFIDREPEEATRKALSKALSEILGGELVVNRDTEYVKTTDGRTIPMSALSSGQQELLPLLTVLPVIFSRERRRLLYIEELEAHLFPMAQSKLVEILASVLNQSGPALDMVLTTHSPYVLAKLNNLIKAGVLGKILPEPLKPKLGEIINKRFWLGTKFVRAYAIKDGILDQIIDPDGFIDADYLDDVSGDISKEFSKLLELEVSK
jgi:hypothetical protein